MTQRMKYARNTVANRDIRNASLANMNLLALSNEQKLFAQIILPAFEEVIATKEQEINELKMYLAECKRIRPRKKIKLQN